MDKFLDTKHQYILMLIYWPAYGFYLATLTHWGRVTHICVSKLTIIGSDNGLSPVRLQAIIWTNAGILLFEPLGTNFNDTSIEIHTFSFKKIHLKLSSGKWRPFCLGLNVLTRIWCRQTWIHCLYLYLVKVLANGRKKVIGRRRYICDVFSHWLRPCCLS